MPAARIDWHLVALHVEAKRLARGLTLFELCRQADLPPNTIRRAREGRPLTEKSFLKLCAWQNEAPEIYHGRGTP